MKEKKIVILTTVDDVVDILTGREQTPAVCGDYTLTFRPNQPFEIEGEEFSVYRVSEDVSSEDVLQALIHMVCVDSKLRVKIDGGQETTGLQEVLESEVKHHRSQMPPLPFLIKCADTKACDEAVICRRICEYVIDTLYRVGTRCGIDARDLYAVMSEEMADERRGA